MFKWIERKIIRPLIKKPEKLLAVGAAAALGPVAGATLGKLTASAATKTALISGAANLAGAVLTRNDAKKENNRVLAANKAEAQRVQKVNEQAVEKAQKQNTEVRENYYKNVVEDAQAAGINPLTALRTGGGQGYATAVAGTMNNAVLMEGVYATPTLSRNPVAAGIEASTNIYLQELTRQRQYNHESRMDELNKSLIKAQIHSMNAQIANGKNGEDVELKFAGKKIEVDENFSNVEDYEKRYGDIVSALIGAGIALADARKTAAVMLSNEKTANFSLTRRRKSRKQPPKVTVKTLDGPLKRGEMRGAY
jgi:hypothetical protein